MVQASIEADLELLAYFDDFIGQLELDLERTAKVDEPQMFFLVKMIPGVGRIIGMTLLYEICTIERFPRIQDFISYCRLVRPPKTSAGKPTGEASGKKIGNAHLKWALSKATLLLVRESAHVRCSSLDLSRSTARARRSRSSLPGSAGRSTTCFENEKPST
jgi:transposase